MVKVWALYDISEYDLTFFTLYLSPINLTRESERSKQEINSNALNRYKRIQCTKL